MQYSIYEIPLFIIMGAIGKLKLSYCLINSAIIKNVWSLTDFSNFSAFSCQVAFWERCSMSSITGWLFSESGKASGKGVASWRCQNSFKCRLTNHKPNGVSQVRAPPVSAGDGGHAGGCCFGHRVLHHDLFLHRLPATEGLIAGIFSTGGYIISD